MTPLTIFATQSTLSIVVFALLARWYVAPRLARRPLEDALVPLLMVHAFRYTPMTLLVPGQVEAAVPDRVATSIAYGDLVSGVLALLAAVFLRYRWPGAVVLTWVFSFVGIADVLMAGARGMGAGLYQYELGFNWYILNFYVPALIVTHVMILHRLVRRDSSETTLERAPRP